jgi:hypothetical protein
VGFEAVLGGGIAHVDKAPVEGFPNVPAKPAVGNFEALTSHQLPIKPSRPIGDRRRSAAASSSLLDRNFVQPSACARRHRARHQHAPTFKGITIEHGDCAMWYQFCQPDVSLMARAPIHDVRELSRPLKHEDDMAKKAKKAKKTAAATKTVAKKTTAKKKK